MKDEIECSFCTNKRREDFKLIEGKDRKSKICPDCVREFKNKIKTSAITNSDYIPINKDGSEK